MDHYERLFGNAGYIARRIASDVSGPAAIPRRNGEPVFNEPWESRVFGAAVALCERGLFEWDEFRDRLIAEIASAGAGRHRVCTATVVLRMLLVSARTVGD